MHNLSVPLFNIHVLSTFCFGHWANVVQLQLTIFDCHTKSKLSVNSFNGQSRVKVVHCSHSDVFMFISLPFSILIHGSNK